MHERFCERIESGSGKPRSGVSRERTKPLDRGAIERQIGRLLGRNSRAAARYAIRLVDDPTLPAGLRLDWSMRPEWDDWVAPQRGLLRAAHQRRRLDAEDAVADLHPAHRGRSRLPHPQERAVDPADLAPGQERVQAHILVCFLAYVLWKTLEQWQSRAGLGNSPRTILEELAAIQSADVVLPDGRRSGRELRLRCVVRPDRAQADPARSPRPAPARAPAHAALACATNVVPTLDA